MPKGHCSVTLVAMTVGLRERKRRQVAHELAKSAFDLAKKRGVPGFTIDELTEQAGYARRTFANYYSCKEDAITALALEQLHAGIASLPKDEEDLPLIDWVQRLAKHQLSSGLLDVLIELETLTSANPSLEPYLAKVYAEIPLVALETVRKQFPGKAAHEKTGILIGAVYGALTMMLSQIPRATTAADAAESGVDAAGAAAVPDSGYMRTLVDRVFAQLKAGF